MAKRWAFVLAFVGACLAGVSLVLPAALAAPTPTPTQPAAKGVQSADAKAKLTDHKCTLTLTYKWKKLPVSAGDTWQLGIFGQGGTALVASNAGPATTDSGQAELTYIIPAGTSDTYVGTAYIMRSDYSGVEGSFAQAGTLDEPIRAECQP